MDFGRGALLLTTSIFSSFFMTWGVGFDLSKVLFNTQRDGFTLEWIENVGTTGGGENSHLSSLMKP